MKPSSARAIVSKGIESSRPTAIAASAFATFVPPGELQAGGAEPSLPGVEDLEGRASRFEARLARLEHRIVRLAIRHHAALDPRQEAPRAGVVDADDDRAVEGHPVRKRREGVEDVGQVPVGVEVVGLDVRDDRHDGG